MQLKEETNKKMNSLEFISLIKSRGATIIPTGDMNSITIANTGLQTIRAAMLPGFLLELYQHCFGITMGSACIFGPTTIDRKTKYPLPSIFDINKDVSGNRNIFGKTIFGRNDLFWFATDAMGKCFMLDNLTLSVLKTYDDPYHAMNDCLIIGKI